MTGEILAKPGVSWFLVCLQDFLDLIEPAENFMKSRRINNQNVVHRLLQRETHNGRPGTQFHQARLFYTNVFPNFTVVNVEKPPCFLRKFSPDGRYFIAFSADQTAIEIYSFGGSGAAEDLLKSVQGDVATSANDRKTNLIRAKLFERFFKLKYTTIVATSEGHLNRECSLFTDDGRYVIVGSSQYVPEHPHPLFYDANRNSESVFTEPQRFPLEDYSLHIVELETGHLCDSRHFKYDKIFLSHNQGLYLYKDTLAVLSVKQQTIHIFHITPCGKFVDVRRIGMFCSEDDMYYFQFSESSSGMKSCLVEQHYVLFSKHGKGVSYKQNNINHSFIIYAIKEETFCLVPYFEET